MIRLPEKPSSEALPFSCTTDSKRIKAESEPQSHSLCGAPGRLVFSGVLARLPRKLSLGELGTHCLLEENPIQELWFVPRLDSPDKGAQGRPREGNEQQKPRAWLTTHRPPASFLLQHAVFWQPTNRHRATQEENVSVRKTLCQIRKKIE